MPSGTGPGDGAGYFSVRDSAVLPIHLAATADIAAAYADATAERDATRNAMLRRAGITEGTVDGSQDVVSALFALLERHRRAG